MSEPNFVGNIIIVLANLPDFLRKPILKKRMLEFFTLPDDEKFEIINNALQAGPEIPFPNFSKLFKTWLEVLALIKEEQRNLMFSFYIHEIVKSPQKLIEFNLDGILGIFMSLKKPEKLILANTIKQVLNKFDNDKKRKLFLIIPKNAKNEIGFTD